MITGLETYLIITATSTKSSGYFFDYNPGSTKKISTECMVTIKTCGSWVLASGLVLFDPGIIDCNLKG